MTICPITWCRLPISACSTGSVAPWRAAPSRLSEILRNQFGHRSGACTVIGSDLQIEAPTAALLNGAAGHALDYDDTGSSIGCHSTAPVLPAVLAVAEEIGASGKALIAAFVVGVEIEGRINHAMGRDHYPRGWHTTATYGTFGATAAVAHLLKLPKGSVRHGHGAGRLPRLRREGKFRHHDEALSPGPLR